jgi:hypothetical protein
VSWRLAVLACALGACGRERADPRLAEVTSPLHVTVRVVDAPVARTCTGTTLEQLGCFTSRAEREGCVYVELGASADAPEKSKQPDAHRCGLMHLPGLSGDRALLRNTPGRKATLYVEPGGERVVVDLPESTHAIYVRGGHLQVNRKLWDEGKPAAMLRPDGTLNWSLVPPYLAVLGERELTALSEEELDSLLAQTPGGKAALKESLVSLTSSADALGETWTMALSKLEPSDHVYLRQALLDGVSSGTDGALSWFLHRPEEQGPDFIDVLEEAVSSSSSDPATGLLALLNLAPARAEKLACDQLEQKWHENTGSDSYGFISPDTASLAVIASQRSKCPWVIPLLERNPCAWELRCDPDMDDKKETPLCTAAQSATTLQQTLAPDDDLELNDEGLPTWGALMLAAALVQGPLPPAFKLANERRLYAPEYTFKGDEADDRCRELVEQPPDWACRLPVTITTSTNEGCRLVLDDKKKTMTLTPVAVP